MRLYSLKHSPLFKFNNQHLKSITPKSIFKQRAIYDNDTLIRATIANGKCFIAMSLGLKIRQSQIIVEEIAIADVYVTNYLLILIGEDKYVGWMPLKQLVDKFNNYHLNKLILSTKQFQPLPFHSHPISIVQPNGHLVFIFSKQRTIFIYKYNSAMAMTYKQIPFEAHQSQVIRSIVVHQNYDYNQDVCFILNSNRNVYIYELDSSNQVSCQLIAKKQVDEQLIQMGRVSPTFIVLYCNYVIHLVQKEGGKWNILAQIITQATVISMHVGQNSIITHQKCQLGFNVLRYGIEDICSFTRVVPSVLSSKKEYYPLCAIKGKQLCIWMRRDEAFLLRKPVFQLTNTINGCCDSLNLKMLNNKTLFDQLQQVSLIEPFFTKTYQSFSSLGITNKWLLLNQLISEYLSIFISLTASLNPHILLPLNFILPLELQVAVRDTNIICAEQSYNYNQSKMTKGLVSRLRLMNKKAHSMSIVASLTLSQKENIFGQLNLNQLVCLLYDSSHFIQYLVQGMRRCNTNKGLYLQYRQVLSSITKYQKDLNPFIYLLTHRPFQFLHSSLRAQLKNKQISQQQNEIEQYLQKYRSQRQQFSQGLLLNSISKVNSQVYQDQVKQMGDELAFEMAFSMQERHELCFLNLGLGPFYDYCCRLKLVHMRVIKIILLQYQESKFRSSYNQSVCKLNFKNLFKEDYQAIKEKLIIQEPNLIDNLIQNYLLHLQQICSQFNLRFTGKLFEKKKEIEFDNLLKDKKIHISRIKQEEDSFCHKQFDINCTSEQQPFKDQLNKALWDMYLSLVNFHQYHFQVYQHLRDTHFVECLIDNHHSNHYKPISKHSKPKKDGRRFLEKLSEGGKGSKLSLREMEEKSKFYYWMKLIQLCHKANLRWIGDPHDLLQQILSQWYIFSTEYCKQAMDLIYELFSVEQQS